MTTEPSTEDIIEAGRVIAPEHMRKEVKISATVEQTISKLTANSFQYATAGDSRRLIERLALLSRQVEELTERYDVQVEYADELEKELADAKATIQRLRKNSPTCSSGDQAAIDRAVLSSTKPETEKQ